MVNNDDGSVGKLQWQLLRLAALAPISELKMYDEVLDRVDGKDVVEHVPRTIFQARLYWAAGLMKAIDDPNLDLF